MKFPSFRGQSKSIFQPVVPPLVSITTEPPAEQPDNRAQTAQEPSIIRGTGVTVSELSPAEISEIQRGTNSRAISPYDPNTPFQLATQNGGKVPSAAAAPPAFAVSDPHRFRPAPDPRFRPYSQVSVDTLRLLGRTYDVLASCIAHLKSEVLQVPVKFVPIDDKDDSEATKKQVKDAAAWFRSAGGLGGYGSTRAEYEGKLLDDLLIVGASAINLGYETRGSLVDGNPDWARAIDAATIAPLVTPYGFAPGENEYAYEQKIMGVTTASFTRRDLIYSGLPIFARTDSPYYLSGVELLVMVVFTALKSDEWNRTWLTSGTTPDWWIEVPQDMTTTQYEEWREIFNLMMAGNSAERHSPHMAPGTVKPGNSRKDQDFQLFEHWLRDRTCAIMGVNPASIGHHGDTFKASQENAAESTENRVEMLLQWRKAHYDDLLARKGWPLLECIADLPDGEKASERATRHQIEITTGRTINEVRREDGLEPIDDPIADQLLIASGVQLLSQLGQQAADAQQATDQSADTHQQGQEMHELTVQEKKKALAAPTPKPGDVKRGEFDDLDEIERAELSGGRWITVEHHHVYIKNGEVVAGHIHKAADKLGLSQKHREHLVKAHADGQIQTHAHLYETIRETKKHEANGTSLDEAHSKALEKHGAPKKAAPAPEKPKETPKEKPKGTPSERAKQLYAEHSKEIAEANARKKQIGEKLKTMEWNDPTVAKERKQLWAEMEDLNGKVSRQRKDLSKKIIDEVFPPEAGTTAIFENLHTSPELKKALSAKDSSEILSRAAQIFGPAAKGLSVPSVNEYKGARPTYSKSTNTVTLDANTPRKQVAVALAHELGHWVEDRNPAVEKAARDYYKQRTAGKPSVQLKTLNKALDSNEVGVPDNFAHYYFGKTYKSGQTELISHGVEMLLTEPETLMKKDPAFVDFLVSALRPQKEQS